MVHFKFQFSVVIPLYNCEDYILKTLKSLEDQSFRNFEVIIVDDHSTDDSYDKTLSFLSNSSLNSKLVKRPDSLSKGVASSRNFGVQIANGEWICFLDSDDLFSVNKLHVLYQKICTIDSEYNCVYHPFITIREDGKEIKYRAHLDEEKEVDLYSDLLKQNVICTSTVAIKRNVFSSFKFNERLQGVEDYFLWLQISKSYNWLHINEPLTYYRLRDRSLMRNNRLDHYLNQYTLLHEELTNSKWIDLLHTQTLMKNQYKNIVHFYLPNSVKQKGFIKSFKKIFISNLQLRLKAKLFYLMVMNNIKKYL